MFSLYGCLAASLGIVLCTLAQESTDTNRLDQHRLLYATAVVD
jgi:hypothetical protein